MVSQKNLLKKVIKAFPDKHIIIEKSYKKYYHISQITIVYTCYIEDLDCISNNIHNCYINNSDYDNFVLDILEIIKIYGNENKEIISKLQNCYKNLSFLKHKKEELMLKVQELNNKIYNNTENIYNLKKELDSAIKYESKVEKEETNNERK
jgi:hypothetical protein